MQNLLQGRRASGAPGTAPAWTHSTKEGVGTAYHTASRVWFTLSHGILNEIYYPRVDMPQTRDLQYLVTDGATFLHEEKRDLTHEIAYIDCHAPGFRVVCRDPEGRYAIVKEIIADPHLSCLLMHTRLEGDEAFLKKLRLYVLLAPHLEGRGWGNNAARAEAGGRTILVAFRSWVYLALGATAPFRRTSCGYVGATDGWSDLHDNFQMDWEFDYADNGNVALTAEIALPDSREFTLGVGFGPGFQAASTTLLQGLGVHFEEQRRRFEEQWKRVRCHTHPLERIAGDGGRLYCVSHTLLHAHEDKSFPGALIASLSIPWGEERSDEDGLGGYHLVWTRDLCQSASALLSTGDTETPLRALIYLAAAQRPDGGFNQNFWLDGRPHWTGIQLDEVAFPIILAWRLKELDALQEFDPTPMVLKAARFLIGHPPATQQERWEENSGYSPSTLAAHIAGLVCAADFARLSGDEPSARFIEDYADFLEARVERWTVTTEGTVAPGIQRHYIRINPVDPNNPRPVEDPNVGIVTIRNRPPDVPSDFPARDIVDAGFLELVRYGIRRPRDPLIEDSLRVVDAVLKVDTPFGPCWRRYNHDGFGQRDDGRGFNGWGVGRAWPLLAGERAHYELAAGRPTAHLIRAIEGFATKGGMLPEQIWDRSDLPERELYFGRATGAAMPLMWAHSEYMKLLRSAYEEEVFDRISIVERRYSNGARRSGLEIWKLNRRPSRVVAGATLRV
ncbi:MAG TPA: glycoside hydrolase family 15 protein, partial [Candidatus Binatia bacterium]|nr:glycoside hydrolase family 15 protein [Candidatus Binatia bacterium]